MDNNCVRLIVCGDFCSKPSTSFISVSDELKEVIRACDLCAVNFEVPLKPDAELPTWHYERLWQHDDAPDFLKGLGFNLFPLANNHTFDWGIEGFRKTKSALGSASFGSGHYDEAYSIKIVEGNGIRIGFMALSYAARYGVFDDVMKHEGLGCAYINDLRVNHDIIEAKKQVDYLFVLPHDGIEYIDVPLPETIARYRDFIDYGADAVIGTHPHCPQGWEEYKGKPIFYSLGNFFFNSKDDTSYLAWNRPHWYEGLSVLFYLDSNGLRYETINTRNIDNVSIVIDKDSDREKHNAKVCRYLKDKESYMEYLMESISQLANTHEIAIVDRTLHRRNLKAVAKLVLKRYLKSILNRDKDDDTLIKMLMKNDTRRMGLIRFMNNK